jgi:WD40 repeat protein
MKSPVQWLGVALALAALLGAAGCAQQPASAPAAPAATQPPTNTPAPTATPAPEPLDMPYRLPHDQPVTLLSISPDGARLAIGLQDGTILVRDVASGVVLNQFEGHAGPVTSILWLSGITELISGDSTGTIIAWQSSTAEPLFEAALPGERIANLHWSSDGTQIVAQGENGSVLALSPSGEAADAPQEAALEAATPTFTTDGTFYASIQDGGVDVVEFASGDQHQQITLDDPVSSLAWADTVYLAAGTATGLVVVWANDTGHMLRQLIARSAEVTELAFNPSADRLAAGMADGSLVVWDVTSSERIGSFVGQARQIEAIA